jgi:hypothetical protein
LVEAVLEQVKTGQVVLGEAGRGVMGTGTGLPPAEVRIETPYLQLVMSRVWDEEMKAGSRTLRLATLQRLGDAEKIVRTHLDIVMQRLPRAQRKVAARLFHYLVTPSGTKIGHTIHDLAIYAEVEPGKVEPVLQRLSAPDIRLLRPVVAEITQRGKTHYEIFHDVLALPIIEWRARYWRTRRLRTQLSLAAVALAIIIVFFLLLNWGLTLVSEGATINLCTLSLCLFPILFFLLLGFYLGVRWERVK